ncbi:ferredoxin [Streptomyces zagrosensis]|uniref:Ferredoxin n=1 Tax=Streptomyces zagrosensis TaxID=1042984 RepID=A0A7W9Q4V0_9ACTN|nr:ferredoxin [Streptomyces zagrosensis]MBB5933238.1 ferredoxin [Streptomyces zagrosensis]
MTERWHIEVDQDACIGSGMCVGSAPDAFRRGVVGAAEPIAAETDPSDPVLDAAESCPVEAITIRSRASGELIFPPVD